jgi:hypothetical protein
MDGRRRNFRFIGQREESSHGIAVVVRLQGLVGGGYRSREHRHSIGVLRMTAERNGEEYGCYESFHLLFA